MCFKLLFVPNYTLSRLTLYPRNFNGDYFSGRTWLVLVNHYANDVIEFVESENLNYVPKIKNPQNKLVEQSRTFVFFENA